MNKRKLYENIINNVSRELKRALNEDFQFDDTEIADKLFDDLAQCVFDEYQED